MNSEREELLKAYQNKLLKLKSENRLSALRHVRYLLEALERLNLRLEGGWLGAYEKEALSFKNGFEMDVDAKWLTVHFRHLSIFLNWLLEKRKIRNNPLKPFNEPGWRLRMEDLCEKRREERKLSVKNVKEESLPSLYEKDALKQKKAKYAFKRYRHAADEVMAYAASLNKKQYELKKEDEEGLMIWLVRLERYPSQHFVYLTVAFYYQAARNYLKWLYEKGFREDILLKESVSKRFKGIYEAEMKRREEELKKRYYSVKEILKAYKRYLFKKRSHYLDISQYYSVLVFLIRFLLRKGKTLYTADEETMEAFKEYLMEHEYLPGVYLTAKGQAKRLSRVRRFFDWFNYYGYRQDNPLKKFIPLRYQREIEERCKGRERGNLSVCAMIPEAFRKAYEGVSKYYDTMGLSDKTVYTYKKGWRFYLDYLDRTGIEKLEDATEEVILDYHHYLLEFKNAKGGRLKSEAVFRHLLSVKKFYQYLARFRFLSRDYSLCVKFPKMQRGLPTAGMEDAEVRRLLEKIDTSTPKGIRDRTMMEIFYSTGVRANELRNLKIKDVYFNEGLLRVNVPKGGIRYQRVIPVGKIACQWLIKYLNEVRGPVDKDGEDYLFLGRGGKPLCKLAILCAVKIYKIRAGIKKNVVTHSFRVSCATEMLKGRADIKYVQQQLGHTSIQSTEKYLRLMPKDLKEVHKRTHPRERKNNF